MIPPGIFSVFVVAVALTLTGFYGVLSHTRKERDAARTELAQMRGRWLAESEASAAAQREITKLREKAQADEVAVAQREAARSQEHARALRAAADRLRAHTAELAASASAPGSHPTPAAGSATASGPGLVLAELYRSADEEAIELAVAFDRARLAGQTCERLYDSVRNVQ